MKNRFFNILLGLTVGGMVIPFSSLICVFMTFFYRANICIASRENLTSGHLMVLGWLNVVGVFTNFLDVYVLGSLTLVGVAVMPYILFKFSRSLTVILGLGVIIILTSLFKPQIEGVMWTEIVLQVYVLCGVFVF